MTALTAEEFEAICEWFHDCGKQGIDFKTALGLAKQESKKASEELTDKE